MKLRNCFQFILVLLLLATGVAVTHQPLLAEVSYDVRSNLWFEGTSTVRDWACKDVPVEGELQLPEQPESPQALLDLLESTPDSALQTELTFPVQEIGCEQDEKMNNHMRNALESSEYPNITFTVNSIDDETLVDTPNEQVEATIAGDLTIKDTTKTVEIPVKARVPEENSIRVKGELPLDITEYGVEPPTVMWTITVYDKITIHPKFTIRPGEESKE